MLVGKVEALTVEWPDRLCNTDVMCSVYPHRLQRLLAITLLTLLLGQAAALQHTVTPADHQLDEVCGFCVAADRLADDLSVSSYSIPVPSAMSVYVPIAETTWDTQRTIITHSRDPPTL